MSYTPGNKIKTAMWDNSYSIDRPWNACVLDSWYDEYSSYSLWGYCVKGTQNTAIKKIGSGDKGFNEFLGFSMVPAVVITGFDSYHAISVFNTEGQELPLNINYSEYFNPRYMAYSRHRKWLAIAGHRSAPAPRVRLLRLSGNTTSWGPITNILDDSMFTDYNNTLEEMEFSPDGNFLSAAGFDGYQGPFYYSQLEVQIRKWSWPFVGGGDAFAYSNDGLLLGFVSSIRTYVYQRSDNTQVFYESGTPDDNIQIVFSPDDSLMVVLNQDYPSGRIRIFNTVDWSYNDIALGLTDGQPRKITFNPDGSLLAIACYTYPFLIVYNTSDWSRLSDIIDPRSSHCLCLRFSLDGNILYLGWSATPGLTAYNTADWSSRLPFVNMPIAVFEIITL